MFKIGDKVVYGMSGVCEICDIAPIESDTRDYYKLKPYFGSEVIFAPVGTKVFMREIMSREEAEKLIRRIPYIDGDDCEDKNFLATRKKYQDFIGSHDVEDLIRLIKGIYEKGEKKKLGMVDEQYMKRAEDLLYGELAIVLDIGRDAVCDYIKNTLK